MKISVILALFVTLIGSLSFPQSLWAQSVFENPQPGSFQSGVGVISGWVCDAQRIDIVFNPGTATEETWRAGYKTTREDTEYTPEGEVLCGDTDNGFGLLFNWNRLDDGVHTVSALADGIEFGRATFTVTTLGKDFRDDVSGEFVVKDFPVDGRNVDVTLGWQQSLQNFVIQGDMRSSGGTSGTPPRILENPQPGSFQSGVGVISGWVCDAQRIDIVFNPGTATEETWRAGYKTTREDTEYTPEGEVLCGDTDNGFGLLFNWNRLDDGVHTVSALADGIEFGRATFTVTTFGESFLRNAGKHARLEDFPDTGTDLIVAWQQSLQNFTIARLDSFAPRIASIDAIGDSISKAVNAGGAGECTNIDQERFNWATSITPGSAFCDDGGDGVYSQAERIECRQGAMIVNADPNSAESGAEMLKDFFAQAQESAALFGTQPPAAPRYVTVEMGHNDICSGTIERIQAECDRGDDQDPMNHCRTTEAAFEREFRKGLDVLIAVPELKIGIAAPVRVTQLCNHKAKTNCSLLGGSCESLWERFADGGVRPTGICGSITKDCSDERLQDAYETAKAYRDIMARVSAEYAALPAGESSPVATVGGEPVGGAVKAAGTSLSFSNASWVYKFTSEQVSCCDCFHPSFIGQDAAARILFDGFTCGPTDVCCADTGDPVSVALCTAEDTGGTFHPGLF